MRTGPIPSGRDRFCTLWFTRLYVVADFADHRACRGEKAEAWAKGVVANGAAAGAVTPIRSRRSLPAMRGVALSNSTISRGMIQVRQGRRSNCDGASPCRLANTEYGRGVHMNVSGGGVLGIAESRQHHQVHGIPVSDAAGILRQWQQRMGHRAVAEGQRMPHWNRWALRVPTRSNMIASSARTSDS